MSIKSWIEHIKDFGLNSIAFGMYVAVQQLIVMPMISKAGDDALFSKMIIFITIFNIVCVVIGDELGNTRLVRASLYKSKNLQGDFHLILFILIGAGTALVALINLLIGMNWVVLCFYTIIAILGILRYYAMAYYKLNQKFHVIFFISLFYSLGAMAGVFVPINMLVYGAPFLIGESLASSFIFFKIILDRGRLPTIAITSEFNNTVNTYGKLSVVSIIMNSISYLDRIIIFPMLGSAAMTLYYSAATMSKMMSLVFNPISGAILAKVSGSERQRIDKWLSIVVKLLPPIFVSITIGSIVMSYIGVKLLYSNYLDDSIKILIPIGLATSFSLISFLLKPLFMMLFNLNKLLLIHIIYAIVFCISMYFFSMWWGIAGFAWANCLARFTQFICYLLIIVISHAKKEVQVIHERRKYEL